MEDLKEVLEMNIIDSFSGFYHFLSNFYICEIEYKGLTFSSVEAAFQAEKCLNEEDKRKFTALSPFEAKRLGRRIKMRSDWDYPINYRLQVMEDLLRIKFSEPYLQKELLATGDAELIECNTWNDCYWGVCKGRGENHLGKLLMKIRNEVSKLGNNK